MHREMSFKDSSVALFPASTETISVTRSLNTRVAIWMDSTVFYSNSGIGVLCDRIYRRVSRHSLVHFRLKPHCQLIPNQKLRTGHHRPGNGQHLLLAARHGASLLLGSFLQYREQLAHILDIFSNGFATYFLLTHEIPSISSHQYQLYSFYPWILLDRARYLLRLTTVSEWIAIDSSRRTQY